MLRAASRARPSVRRSLGAPMSTMAAPKPLPVTPPEPFFRGVAKRAAFAAAKGTLRVASSVASIFDPPGKHDYEVNSFIGTVPHGQSRKKAIMAAQEDMRDHAAPGAKGKKSTVEGSEVEVFGLGPVRTTASKRGYSLVNKTLPGHLLHRGEVKRQLYYKDRNLYLRTNGTGYGALPKLNNGLSNLLWDKFMARGLRKNFNERHQKKNESSEKG